MDEVMLACSAGIQGSNVISATDQLSLVFLLIGLHKEMMLVKLCVRSYIDKVGFCNIKKILKRSIASTNNGFNSISNDNTYFLFIISYLPYQYNLNFSTDSVGQTEVDTPVS